jgi:glycine C-acetyltransferase
LLKQCRYNSCIATNKFNQSLAERNAAIKEAGTWKEERVITSKQGAQINVEGSQSQILNFCANNYLGLSVSVAGRLIINQIGKVK